METRVREEAPAASRSGGAPSPYDVRKTVQITAPIVGGVGGFVVTAIVLVLTVAADGRGHSSLTALAAALLALALIGCLTGAFALASLAGESDLTINLSTAGMYMSVGPTIAIVAILAAFQVLALIYVPGSKGLFAVTAALVGIGGAIYNGLNPFDEWDIEPGSSAWIKSRRHARIWVYRLALIGATPVALGFLTYLVGATVSLSTAAVTVFVSIGMLIVIVGALVGIFRSMHADDGRDRGTHPAEAIGIQLVLGVYMGLILVFLPQ